ncbi:MAG: heat-inducible transcriptional repressor HrcA, partial [Coprobacillus sp.]
MLSARQLLIFKCIVEEFVETAEPVGSKTLMEKYQLPYSSATIRNEMSYLEETEFLEKTHTSSGRVPSTKGYRFYVNTLLQPSVDDEVKNQVAVLLGDRHRSLNEIIQESCQMLSELTHLTTVALGPDSSYECLQNITLVPLNEHSVTAIIVTDKGHVENRMFNIKNNAYMEDLTSCVSVMNELLDGTPINQVAYRLERDVRPILSARVKEHEVLFNAFLEAFMKFANSHVYFSGKENMLYQPEYN